jgi:hypothetical protein
MYQELIVVTETNRIIIIIVFLFLHHIARCPLYEASVSGFVPKAYFLIASAKLSIN